LKNLQGQTSLKCRFVKLSRSRSWEQIPAKPLRFQRLWRQMGIRCGHPPFGDVPRKAPGVPRRKAANDFRVAKKSPEPLTFSALTVAIPHSARQN
jgi:hypothetical protein